MNYLFYLSMLSADMLLVKILEIKIIDSTRKYECYK